MATARDIPRCTCFLFVAAITCHVAVLVGNIATATMLNNLGTSASGWADVGSSVSHSLNSELVVGMASVASALGDVITYVEDLESGFDTMISVVGSATDTALEHVDLSNASPQQVAQVKDSVKKAVAKVVSKSIAKVEELLNELLVLLWPSLNQTSQWLGQFSDKIIDYLEEFSTTVDRAQKLFDQITAKLDSSVGSNRADVLDDTYNIFDQDNDGSISIDELTTAATAYSITALTGSKAYALMAKYDTSGDMELEFDEYSQMVQDDSVPDLMAIVLRGYTQKLADIGGRVQQSTMRGELTDAVADYLALVSGKNTTKVKWVTSRISGTSIPTRFAADLWYQFYAMEADENAVLIVDIGSLIINYTTMYNGTKVVEALNMLANTTYFVDEGFDYDVQQAAVTQVTQWIELAPQGVKYLKKYGVVTPTKGQNYTQAYAALVKKNVAIYKSTDSTSSTSDATGTAATLQAAILGGQAASAGGTDTAASQTSNSGQPALPSSLAFAAELADNVSTTVSDNNNEASTFTGSSSSATDSVATKVQSLIKNVESFLDLMGDYAGSTGLQQIEEQADAFIEGTEGDIMRVLGFVIDEQIALAQCNAGDEDACEEYKKLVAEYDEIILELSGAITFLTSTLGGLKTALPTVVTDLKIAKTTVMSVASTISSIMQVLGVKAPQIMSEVSGYYVYLWAAYFTFFALFTSMLTFYAFWANGFFGGPKTDEADSSYEPPSGITARLRTCCSSCLACVNSCTSSHLCFWSCLLCAQVLVLLLFIISIVICLITGIQAFFASGCSKIYVISDNSVCTGMMQIFQTFLSTFGSTFSVPLLDMCDQKKLTMCKTMGDEIGASAIYTIIGALLASVFTFEMLLESATKHEKVRCTRLLKAEFPDYKED